MTTDCPECRQGKHTICVEWSLDDADEVVPCPCSIREHRDPPNSVRIYQVVYIGTEAGEAYWCQICGRLDGAVYRGHGNEHIVPDSSR